MLNRSSIYEDIDKQVIDVLNGLSLLTKRTNTK